MSTDLLERPSAEGHHHHDDDHHHDECERQVSITADTVTIHLHRGLYKLDVLKRLSKVPLSDVLEKLVGTELVPVPEDKLVEIKGCEIFASHPQSGGSS